MAEDISGLTPQAAYELGRSDAQVVGRVLLKGVESVLLCAMAAPDSKPCLECLTKLAEALDSLGKGVNT